LLEVVAAVELTLMFQIMVEQVVAEMDPQVHLVEQELQEQLIQVAAVEVVHTVIHHLLLMVVLVVQV
jgi:hypothetical protein